MAYDGKLLARARDALEARQEENRAEQRRRTDAVYARVPEIRELDLQMRRQMAELVRLTISKPAGLAEKLKALEQSNLDIQVRRAEKLVEFGYPVEYLDEIYSCPKCRDTGVYKGGVCSCLEKLYNAELTKELGTLLKNGDESFERFDLSLYSAGFDSSIGASPREVMSLTYDNCRRFADNFPNVMNNLLLQGGTGLGKTYLSACIARAVAEKGMSVCYDSAAAALETFERQKFSRDAAEADAAAVKVRRMLSCDLMILDDLGTEMVTPMSQSALYTLINTRLNDGRRTIISTNLKSDELERKYMPQIVSRIEGEFISLPFVGMDIRRLKKEGV